MTQRSLATPAIECARLFDSLSSQLLDREQEIRTSLLQPSIEDECARYKIWAGNLGAFQRLPALSSLEYRLKDSPKVAIQIEELLEDLRHALQKISSIASGESPNRMAELTDSEDDSEDESEDEVEKDLDESKDGADEDVVTEMNADGRPRQLSEAGELFGSMKDTITGLFRISIVIRKASPRDRFAKALTASQQPFNNRFDIDHVGNKFPMLNTKEKEWFKERVGRAITQRRQYLRYARDHRDKLAREPEDIRPAEIKITRPTSTLAPTTASTLLPERLMIQEEELQDTQSQTSYAISLDEDDVESHLHLPSLDDISNGLTVFECPLCWTVQDIQRDSTWRKHAFGDLRPYVCTFKDCDTKLFTTRREWFEHELSYHRAQWSCGFCEADNFRSLNLFKEHVRSRHMQSIEDHQLHALIEASRRFINRIPALDCPFCQEWEAKIRLANPDISADEIVLVSPTQFRHHVGAHMQQLALFSVPRGFLEDGTDMESGASSSNSQLQGGQNRSEQLTAPMKACVPRYCFADDIFWFIIECEMEDGRHWELQRVYQDFYDLQIQLLATYPVEAGTSGQGERTLPWMPGPVTYVTDNISNGRRANLDEYIKNLLQLGPHITQGQLVKGFFAPRQGDHEIDPDIDIQALDDLRLSQQSGKSSNHSQRSTFEMGKQIPHLHNRDHSAIAAEGEFSRALRNESIQGQQAPEGHEEVSGLEHTETREMVNDPASASLNQGESEDIDHLVQTMQMNIRELGEDHPETLLSILNAATMYKAQGRWKEAEELFRQGLKAAKELLGEDKYYTSSCRIDLISIHWRQGRLKEAEKLEVEETESQKRVREAERPEAIASMSRLALIYEEQGRRKEALELFTSAVKLSRKTLGDEHPRTLASIEHLALTLKHEGRWRESEQLLVEVLESKERVLGTEHPSTLNSMHNLAVLYEREGRSEEARTLVMQATEIRQKLGQESEHAK